jgi:hypothetical protein
MIKINKIKLQSKKLKELIKFKLIKLIKIVKNIKVEFNMGLMIKIYKEFSKE